MPMEVFQLSYFHVYTAWKEKYGEPHWVRVDDEHVCVIFRVNGKHRKLARIIYSVAEEREDRFGLRAAIERADKVL